MRGARRKLGILMAAGGILTPGVADAIVRNDAGVGPSGELPFAVEMGDASEYFCSGTLIGNGSYVITAEHCLLAGTDGTSYRFMQDDGTMRSGIGSVAVHPLYDVAIVRLGAPMSASVDLFTGSDEVGREIAFAGYGISSTTPGMGFTDLPFGTKRVGANILDFVGTETNTLGFDFDLAGGVGTGGLGDREATTMTGDSGMGYVTEITPGEFELLGVHTGISPNQPNRDQTFSFGVRVSTITDWIGANIPAPGGVGLAALVLAGAAGRRRRA